jgi:hypothetical protein
MMNVYAERFPQEKIHIHFDKNVYNPGETIWFKAYIFADGAASEISKTFYTELADTNGHVLQRKTSPIIGSTAWGSFDLPKDIQYHQIYFRAYTAWMKNFDTTFLFGKSIPIINGNVESLYKPLKKEWRLHFFPEGGDIVAGIENNIAFKANDQFGVPVAIRGIIKNKAGKEFGRFKPEHDGMGSFLITPPDTGSLYAFWQDADSVERITALPVIKIEGAILNLKFADRKLLFSVSRSLEMESRNDQFTLIAYMNQSLIYQAKINLRESFKTSGQIPIDNLPSGILYATLFNADKLPVSERVVFINNHDFEFPAGINLIKQNISKRAANEIEIDVPDTLRTNLSLSITDALADGIHESNDNIITRLLFTGDVRGIIYHPYFYFQNSSDSVQHFLDLVMLTHGWRRFNWDLLVKGKTPEIKYKDNNYLQLTVELNGITHKKIKKNESLNIILGLKDSSRYFLPVPLSAENKFMLNNGLIFFDTASIGYSFSPNKNFSPGGTVSFSNGLMPENNNVQLVSESNTIYDSADSSVLYRNKFINEESEGYAFTNQKIKTLKPVILTAKSREQVLDDKYASGVFKFSSRYSFDVSNDSFSILYPDALEYIRGKVAGLYIYYNPADGEPHLIWRGTPMNTYVDQIKVDPNTLKSLPVSNIAYIKVFDPGESLILPRQIKDSGTVGFNSGGAVVVFTRKGDDFLSKQGGAKDFFTTEIMGYSPVKEFYSPDYSVENDLNKNEDTRTTLLWKPHIATNKDNRKVIIKFYNNDITRVIRIVLEGINEEGRLTRVEKIIQ